MNKKHESIINQNKQDFINEINPYIVKLKEKFNFDYIGFNTDGGTGYQLDIQTQDKKHSNSFFIWFSDKDEVDMNPEDFEINKKDTYTLKIQVQIKDDLYIGCFKEIEEAISFYEEKLK